MAADLHPLIERAGREGRLPDWAFVDPSRRAHIRRVVELIDHWAEELGVEPEDRVRWCAAARFHDALKGHDPAELRVWANPDLPDPILHGPACAGRLRAVGVDDEPVLLAIGYHSVGHPGFDELGQYLYLADYLEPGRKSRTARRERLRSRLPEAREEVLIEVAALRIGRLLDKRLPILQATRDFWNHLVAEGA